MSPVGWIINLTKTGAKKLSSLSSANVARQARKQGKNVLAPNIQASKAIERSAFAGTEDVLRHKGHDLANGTKGRAHFQTPDKYGHTFWSGAVGLLVSFFNPFDAISGELANGELPDHLRPEGPTCP